MNISIDVYVIDALKLFALTIICATFRDHFDFSPCLIQNFQITIHILLHWHQFSEERNIFIEIHK